MTEQGNLARVNILLPEGDERTSAAALVPRILQMLRAHPATRRALESAAGEMPPAGFVTLAELGGGPPRAGVPFYNEAIGVLSVPAPREDAVGAVRAALAELDGLDIQLETTMRTQ